MPRHGLKTATVVDAALAVLDEGGPGALTVSAVAERTRVAAPSLYKHIGGIDDLHALVAARALAEMADRFAAAAVGRSRDDAVRALLHEYRGYVNEYPGRYAIVPPDPLGEPALNDAAARLLEVFLAVLRGFNLRDSDAVHAARCARVVAHGFASLEAAGGFGLPEQLDETYQRLIEMYLASLPRP